MRCIHGSQSKAGIYHFFVSGVKSNDNDKDVFVMIRVNENQIATGYSNAPWQTFATAITVIHLNKDDTVDVFKYWFGTLLDSAAVNQNITGAT